LAVRNPTVGLYQLIEPDLARVERRVVQAAALPHPMLRAILEQVMLAPGKRIRPALTVASSRLFRDGGEPLYAMAAAVEFLHVATLVHDDVVDQTELRRGSPALYSVVGNRVALLVGDYLLAQAAATASETNNLRIMRLFADSVMALCAGQIDECSRDGDDRWWVDRETYYRTIEAKTAALFVLACKAGAILGEAPLAETEALAQYGRSLGLAFQVVDDVLDLVGDEAAMGKPAGSDLRQGLVTLPVIYLREEVPEALLLEAFGSDGTGEEAIQSIVARARGSRAIDRAYREARDLAEEAARRLDGLPRGDYWDFLVELTRSVVDRQA
jgi:geranylgeranyl pyrophosphate synthase